MAARRHIQDHGAGGALEPHWGYPERVVPCANDAVTCAYLDVVYAAHDNSMRYAGILWASLGALLLLWLLAARLARPTASPAPRGAAASSLGRLRRAAAAAARRRLLPDAGAAVFGRATRLQALILALLAAYVAVWSFVGIAYGTWRTPVKDAPGVYSTRTSLAPWANRVGVLAYALTPLSVLLAARESLLSLLTGVPHQSFNFLHRWLGYLVCAQAVAHSVAWCVVQLRLYQPQPAAGREWFAEAYVVWGVVATALLVVLVALSTPWAVRATGYDFFRKAHYVLAMVYLGACWAHWDRLGCFVVPALLVWGIDRAARLVRTALLHYRPGAAAGFQPARATLTLFPDAAAAGDAVVRLDMDRDDDGWAPGQHFYLCFAACSIWQSHPFTPLDAPRAPKGLPVRHSYLVRAKAGETAKLAALATGGADATPVVLAGPYGEDLSARLALDTNVMCVAGGTGITYVLPLLLRLAREAPVPGRRIELVWAVRHVAHVAWVRDEMEQLRAAPSALGLTLRLFATRDAAPAPPLHEKDATEASSAASDDAAAAPADDARRHPDLGALVGEFLEQTVAGRTVVFASGPGAMVSDLRRIVAACNAPAKVWRRQDRFDVELVCDDRLE